MRIPGFIIITHLAEGNTERMNLDFLASYAEIDGKTVITAATGNVVSEFNVRETVEEIDKLINEAR